MDNNLEMQIRESRKLLQNPYAYLNGEGKFDAMPRRPDRIVSENLRSLQNPYASLCDKDERHESISAGEPVRRPPIIDSTSVRGNSNEGERRSNREIESIVRNLQKQLWLNRSELFPDRELVNPLDVLDPLVALESIGYQSEVVEELGQHQSEGETFEVAGVIDRSNRRVLISRRFPLAVRNFTAAHELGHAVLHEGAGLHRDRALDGAAVGVQRDRKETEADVFAACFLMPEKQVRIEFESRFGTQQFTLDEHSAFALNRDLDTLLRTYGRTRALSRLLSDVTYYNGIHFDSLFMQFRVSTEAMAIRLEELNLICPGSEL